MSELSVSIVVPVANGGTTFADCLAALCRLAPPPNELIVVDDGSTDGSAERAIAAGARVIRMARRAGPAAARNRGAAAAAGDVILFVDADVLVAPDTLARVRDVMTDRSLTAVIGSYDSRPTAPGLVSQYKNLIHRFVHQTSGPDAFTFWCACGAIRREVFLSVGGFDERYVDPSIEDIELGYRLRHAGYRIRLEPTLEVTHAKRWTLTSWLRTDIVARAVPWSDLLLREGRLHNGLNLRIATRVCVLLAWIALVAAIASVAADGAWRRGGCRCDLADARRPAALAILHPTSRRMVHAARGAAALALLPVFRRGVCVCGDAARGVRPGASRGTRLMSGLPIAVLGAGPAGLTAAYALTKAGVPVTVLEAGPHVGGIARTETYKGFRFDIGGHRFLTKLPEVQALWEEWLGDELLRVRRLSRINYRGRFFDYPLRLPNVLGHLGVAESLRISPAATCAPRSRRSRPRRASRTGSRTGSAIVCIAPSSRRIRRKSGACPAR